MGRKRKKNIYFTKETEQVIDKYINGGLSKQEKDRLYTQKIYPVFHEMVPILIHHRDIYHTGLDVEELTAEVEVFLWETLNTCDYDPSKGRAYSYFTRTILNYLYQKQMNNQKMIEKYGLESIDADEAYYIETYFEEPTDFDQKEIYELFVSWFDENIDDLFDKPDEKLIAESILNILTNDAIDLEKKREAFFAIKQQSGIDNNYKINKVIKILYPQYLEMKEEYLNEFELSESYEQ